MLIMKKKLNINLKTSTSTFSNYNKNSYWKKTKDFVLTGFKKSTIIRSELVQSITLDNFCEKLIQRGMKQRFYKVQKKC